MELSLIMLLLVLGAGVVAFANGANDNFKGVASLFGSGTCGYRVALRWGTVATLAGGLAAVFLAGGLVKKFSGKGLVADALVGDPAFLTAVAIGAGATVLLACRLGFPISTTHALTGGLAGAGLAAGGGFNAQALGSGFFLPLLVSPLLAVAAGATLYLLLRAGRLWLGIGKEFCVCVGEEMTVHPVARPAGVMCAEVMPALTVSTGTTTSCRQRYAGRVLGVSAGRLLDGLHFGSAGAVSFSRGLNDTPKIAGLLVVLAGAVSLNAGLAAVALVMALGGLLGARRVAETMSHKLTGMNPGQGFAANLATAALVIGASLQAMPVSTTHVSVGALLGIGMATGQARWKTAVPVLLSWVVTLPCAAGLGALLALVLVRES